MTEYSSQHTESEFIRSWVFVGLVVVSALCAVCVPVMISLLCQATGSSLSLDALALDALQALAHLAGISYGFAVFILLCRRDLPTSP